MRYLILCLYVIVIIFSLGFSALNHERVRLDLYFNSYNLPLALIMALCFGLGLLVGLLMLVVKYWQIMRLKHRGVILEQEIKNLRAIPIKESH